ncbi:MarR family winged helix-turn-helix transcriptional regulator [Actinomadura barringtoniae]|uniref:MarR family winged helix-turn-helix transcriptional regulator n=1 Tax=Actinomadura barringtoniae TaxID=1427535 RepID=UPI0027DDDCA1|nr:MarR family winged helix-turn-helix transcriptional regulator [Actinomadura barringtoniae]
MNDVKLPETLAFRLGTVGAVVADRFAERIAAHDLKPKHAGLLTALSAGEVASQQDLAARLGVAPSLVVALADHLEGLGAIERVRDPRDRRRQVLTLTGHGRELLQACGEAARSLDEEITAGLSAAQRKALQAALGVLAAEAGRR